MSETEKHTPGPWKTKRDNFIEIHGTHFRIVWSEKHNDIAYCVPMADEDNGNANAKLIAAAPDLLEALKATAALWKKHGLGDEDSESEPVWELVCAALKKAGGQ